PEIPAWALRVERGVKVARVQPVRADSELSVVEGPGEVLKRRVSPVDLRAVPPVRVLGGENGRHALAGRERIGHGARDLHGLARPIVVVDRDLDRVSRIGVVADPVVYLELDPGGGEHVDRVGRNELLALEELAADAARIRREPLSLGLGVGAIEWDVAPE